MVNRLLLMPYLFLLFVIGFGWFIIAPLIPVVVSLEHGVNQGQALGDAILLITLYGYAVVVVGLLAGFLSLSSLRAVLLASSLFTLVGFLGRVVSQDFTQLLLSQAVSAVGYPLAIAPVGRIAESIAPKRPNTIVGVSVGSLFFGMASGSITGGYLYDSLGFRDPLLVPLALSVIALALTVPTVRFYPREYRARTLRGFFSPGMVKNWYVGLAMSSLAVTLGGIASAELLSLHVPKSEALSVGGTVGGLSFLGSGVGASVIPPLFEATGRIRLGAVLSGLLAVLSLGLVVYSFASLDLLLVSVSYFLFGVFGNAYWSLALASTVKYVADPTQAGLATSMFSVVSNLGVAVIPTVLGPLLVGDIYGFLMPLAMAVFATVLSPFLKT